VHDDPPIPRGAKVLDSAALLQLEAQAAELDLNQRLPLAWLSEHLAPAGRHYLRPGIWHRLGHRPEVPRHLRCELLIELADGEHLNSLLDLLPGSYGQLPSVRTRDEYLAMAAMMTQARSVREWFGQVLGRGVSRLARDPSVVVRR
jgi:hypothetical protein